MIGKDGVKGRTWDEELEGYIKIRKESDKTNGEVIR